MTTNKAPRLGRRRQAAFAAIALAILSLGPGCLARAAPTGSPLALSGGDFTILKPGTTRVIGHAHYSVEHVGTGDVLHGENRYLNGEYDVETNSLEISPSGSAPTLVSYQHWYYARGGALVMGVRMDARSGDGSCIHYHGADVETQSANLSFPSDTYAGASILVPIAYGLLGNQTDPIAAHFFTCAPGPRLLVIRANIRRGMRWLHYAGDIVAVDVRPKLGWWDVLIEPFVPRIRAWFDPADGFNYLGGEIQRYYHGPQVELVRDREASGAPPAK